MRFTSSLHTRYLLTALFTLGLVACAASAGAAEAGDDRRDPTRFSGDAVALHQAGWTLGFVEHGERPEGGEGASFAALTLVDPARQHALRLTVEFSAWGEEAVGYARERVEVPGERRVYDHEDALFDGLAQGAVLHLYDECGSAVLALVGGDAALGEDDWHVVLQHVEGAGAAKALGHELRARLRAGAHVANVYESTGGVAFVLVSDGGTSVLDARLDAAGAVTALEVLEAPSAWSAGTLRSQGRLARALRGRTVSRVSLSMAESATRVRLDFTRGKGFVIDLADLEYPDDDEGCGC